MKKKWIAYGVTGALGLGLVAGGATAAAAAMDLRTTDGAVVPGGAITGKNGSVLDKPTVSLSVSDTSVTVVSAATPAQVTGASPVSAPSPTASPSPVSKQTPASPVSKQTPASPVSKQSPVSPVSKQTPASPVSKQSPASPVSKQSPASPASVASAPSN
jgi:hypothetical protein